MNNLGEYPELIRMAISARLYALTGLVWTVELRVDLMDFLFIAKTGDYSGMSMYFDLWDLQPEVLVKWADLVDMTCSIFTHAWLYSLKMIPGKW